MYKFFAILLVLPTVYSAESLIDSLPCREGYTSTLTTSTKLFPTPYLGPIHNAIQQSVNILTPLKIKKYMINYDPKCITVLEWHFLEDDCPVLPSCGTPLSMFQTHSLFDKIKICYHINPINPPTDASYVVARTTIDKEISSFPTDSDYYFIITTKMYALSNIMEGTDFLSTTPYCASILPNTQFPPTTDISHRDDAIVFKYTAEYNKCFFRPSPMGGIGFYYVQLCSGKQGPNFTSLAVPDPGPPTHSKYYTFRINNLYVTNSSSQCFTDPTCSPILHSNPVSTSAFSIPITRKPILTAFEESVISVIKLAFKYIVRAFNSILSYIFSFEVSLYVLQNFILICMFFSVLVFTFPCMNALAIAILLTLLADLVDLVVASLK